MVSDSPKSGASSSGRSGEGALAWVRDIAFAGIAVALVISSVFLYSGTWPPMVVIESGSMMHASDRSMLGIIDTGDLTLVKRIDSRADIVTYFEGQRRGYETYGSFGDVLIYSKNGHREITPIIHRALAYVEFNGSGVPFSHQAAPSAVNSTWNFPDLDPPLWGVEVLADLDNAHKIVPLGEVKSWHQSTGGGLVNVTVDLTLLAIAEGDVLHGGYITKGDNNPGPDETPGPGSPGLSAPPVGGPSNCGGFGAQACVPVQPVRVEWVVGKAQGELPWFGVIKLFAGSPNSHGPIPGNSVTNLIIAIVVIAVGPFLFEKAWIAYGDRVTDRIPKRWRDGWHSSWEKLPGGAKRRERRLERAEELAAERRKRGGRRRGGRAR
jgi:signal peptidase I